ncbi:hypothetical protein F5Y05DRAFT_395776 [Hypoxylon sp. FL0543]|nr:hypothetical protein F5Y05DRAFT_395776 [Hypoxylon sp. FL0543]
MLSIGLALTPLVIMGVRLPPQVTLAHLRTLWSPCSQFPLQHREIHIPVDCLERILASIIKQVLSPSTDTKHSFLTTTL